MKLTISSSPHLKSKLNTRNVMQQVLISLIPATAAAVVFFRSRAVFIIFLCVVTSVLTELVCNRIRKQSLTVGDYSAAVTGLLLALVIPSNVTWYGAILGSIFAILAGKVLFGGLGANIVNPALIGRAFLVAAYPKMMTTYVEPFAVDTVTQATPLALSKFSHTFVPTMKLFLGSVSGSLGETSAVCLIVGGLYLIIRKIADWRVPLSATLTAVVIAFIFYLRNPINGSIFFHLFSGGFLLGILFMATDPVTTPVTKIGRYIFGVGCGLMIMILRYFSGLPEGVMYSILFMNVLTPLINRYTKPKRFG